MYILKNETSLNLKSTKKVAEVIGINNSTLSRILNKKQGCSKKIAYIITKLNDKEAEINDYFENRNTTTIIKISCKNNELLKELSARFGKDLNKTLEELLLNAR